ncbi:MAG TPA: RNA polymerase sigma-70 factor [Anseongella sp.]|nr:RNA polymerase sigma-70 factor [Anseongella sp.]
MKVEFSDSAVIRLLSEGSERAFEQVFKGYFKPLHAYAYTILKDGVMAEEMVQNVFYTLWKRKGQLKIEGSLKAYLYRAVHNESLNFLKHQKVRASYQVYYTRQAEKDPGYAAVEPGGPSGGMETEELAARIQNALAGLPAQCRTIFQMSRFDQLKYREIAAELGISVKTVENQMGKALRILRIKLAEFLPVIIILSDLLTGKGGV